MPLMIRKLARVSRHFAKRLKRLDGRRAVVSTSTFASRPAAVIDVGHGRSANYISTRFDPRGGNCSRRHFATGNDDDPVHQRVRSDRLGLCRQLGTAGGNLTGVLLLEASIMGNG